MSNDIPKLSAICPGDLGVKAGFRSRTSKDEITFLPIVGWVSVTNYVAANKEPFAALVLNSANRPVFANKSTFPDYVGLFEKKTTSAEAIEMLRASSTKTPPGKTPQPPSTMPGPLE